MAKKKSPKQLREEARKLMEQAQAEEAARHQEIGKLFVDYIEKGFTGFDLNAFKAQATKAWRQ